jgi:hypothetical protein
VPLTSFVGLIGVNETGMWLEPSYWAWHMAANHAGPLALDAWADAPAFDLPEQRLFGLPYLDASVTLDPQRRVLFLSLVTDTAPSRWRSTSASPTPPPAPAAGPTCCTTTTPRR